MESNGMKVVVAIFTIIMLAPIVIAIVMSLNMMGIKIGPVPIILVIIGIIIAWFVATYNGFINLNQKVKQAQSGIDVYLKKRFDLIPNLVETVKGYKNHEEKVLTEIAELRTTYENSNKDDIKESQDLNNRFTRLLAVVEAYPELKASEQFLNLQKNLSKVESELQAARRIYNSEVTTFNTKRYKFPSNIVAGIFKFEEKSLFEIEDYERENIDIKL